MEECVDGVLMPLYFVMIGIKLDIFKVISNIMCTSWVIALAIATKVLCTLITGVFCNVSLGHSFPLGVLLSTKGLLPLVLLNVGHERGVCT
ncbi:Cation/H(+) antiporter 16 [Bienertia sinuspersici]